MRPLVAVLFLVSISALAADAPTTSPRWRFERPVDKMSDKGTCVLRAPTAKLSLQYQNSAKGTTIYLHSRQLELLAGSVTVMVRVDKNPPFETSYNRGSPSPFIAFEQPAFTQKWFDAMRPGKSVVVRLIAKKTSVTLEEEYSLDGFATALEAYDGCRKPA